MKVSLKEWAKCPKASVKIILHLITSMMYTGINAWILGQISVAVDNADRMWDYIILLMVMCCINTALSVSEKWFRKTALMDIYNSVQHRFTMKAVRVPYDSFTKISCDTVTTIASNLSNIVKVPYVLIDLITDLWAIMVTIFAIYRIDQQIVIPIVIAYTIGGIVIRMVMVKYDDAEKKRCTAIMACNKERAEIINGFAEIRTFCMQTKQYGLVTSLNDHATDLQLRKFRIGNLMTTVFYTVDTVGLLIVLLYVASGIANSVITSGVAMTLVMYVWRLAGPLDDIASLADVYTELAAYCGKFADFMAIPDEEDGVIELDSFNEGIEIDNLSFGYDTTSNVITNMNLSIKKGEKVGICGVSGGGKSTLLKLIPALYRDFEGSIRIDGVDVRKLKIDSVRSKIGFVHQDNHIFDTTIYENIVYGNHNASMSDVVDACKKASIYDFIMSLPDKFETNVGPRGLKLSGGQKQRISLARIFLKDADIILLDEATSALDNESESIVQESLGLFEGKTIITVAHRLSTIRDCDKIVVIDNHNIAEMGTHDELVAKNGVYAGLLK